MSRAAIFKLMLFVVGNACWFYLHSIAFTSPWPILVVPTLFIQITSLIFFPYKNLFTQNSKPDNDDLPSDSKRGEPI